MKNKMKKLIVILPTFLILVCAQNLPNIQDDSILRLTEVVESTLIIPNQDGGETREASNILFMGDDIVFIYTMSWVETNIQYLYYSYCNKNDLTNWTHMGRMKIDRKAEDPYILLKDGIFTIHAEDKPMPNPIRPDNVVCKFTSSDWNYKNNTGSWSYDGTVYATPGGASYSPLLFEENGKRYTFIEERYTGYYNHINIVDGDTRTVLINWTDDLPVMVSDEIFNINNQYVQFFHSVDKDRKRWMHNIAVSDNLLSGWKVQPQQISPIGIYPFYMDEWKYLIEGSGGIYLGIPKYTPKLNENNKPVIKIENNKLIVVEGVPNALRYAWSVWDLQTPGIDKYTTWIPPFGEIIDIIPKWQVDGYEFWVYAWYNETNTSRSEMSDRAIYGTIPVVVEGCMDSKADNYNPEATVDDGSCTYAPNDNAEIVAKITANNEKIEGLMLDFNKAVTDIITENNIELEKIE